jgi:hypothetical protein
MPRVIIDPLEDEATHGWANERIKWNKGERGAADRTSVCGRYVITVVERGCRHVPGLFWAAHLLSGKFIDPDTRDGLTYDRTWGRGTPGAGGPLREAKQEVQAYHDKFGK